MEQDTSKKLRQEFEMLMTSRSKLPDHASRHMTAVLSTIFQEMTLTLRAISDLGIYKAGDTPCREFPDTAPMPLLEESGGGGQ